LDQLTKWWVTKAVEVGGEIAVIPGFFDIVHTRNAGAAFGMMAGADASFRIPFFYGIAAVAVVVIALLLWKMRDGERLLPVAFALIIGGIAGNIVDRLRFGAVTDFLSFHWKDATAFSVPLYWPSFNVADSAITVAMFLLIFAAFRKQEGS
jgi:signal peptidase II